MIGVFVTFRYGDNFDERAVRKIAETPRVRFEGMSGLRSKVFTLNSEKHEAANFYVWRSDGDHNGHRSPPPQRTDHESMQSCEVVAQIDDVIVRKRL